MKAYNPHPLSTHCGVDPSALFMKSFFVIKHSVFDPYNAVWEWVSTFHIVLIKHIIT